jgi:diguanylate cyclase (GGDEF)-like protein
VQPWSPRSVAGTRRSLLVLTALVLVVYLAGLIWHEPAVAPIVDNWLSPLSQSLPAAVCWSALPSSGPRRLEIGLMATGLTVYGAGTVVYVILAQQGDSVAFPSVADLGFLTFYALALAAIVVSARRESRAVGLAVWLDSLLGGLGAAAVLTLVLDGVLSEASDGSLGGGLALIYPVLDLLVVAAVIGVAAMQGRRLNWYWMALFAGFAALAAVDALNALAFADDSYAPGGATDLLWPLGLALIIPWALARPTTTRHPEQSGALLVPAIATASILTVLVASARADVSVLTVVLAALTLVATAGRTQIAFRHSARLADLRHQASTDELTGLRNRRAFYHQAGIALTDPHPEAALLLLDLDQFKEVNDSLGHHIGDDLLREVGTRLREHLGGADLLARLGGDEFAILLADGTREHAVELAVRLRTAVAAPCTLEGIALRTDVSIGVAFAPEHSTELRGLLRCADIAMYQAKRARAGHRIYSGHDDTAGAGRLRVIQELHTALAQDQLILHYQPKLDLSTDQVHHVEALVRWDHPTRGLLYPDSFLSLIEETGLMADLTQTALAQALDQAAQWRDEGRPLNVAVNLSASSLVDTDLPERVGDLLAARNLPAGLLQLEITEDFLMADRERAHDILNRLHDQGIQISVDDFGTGYSSLAYLRDLPVDELKLDRSFVMSMADDARAAALVFSTITLAHSLGLRMVAEGVENETALTELTRHGCDYAQGYHICRALPPAELGFWLDQREPLRSLQA